MAEKEPMIVIKKITIAAPAGHGGSWKVAFADFMTAMMAFFLVMWLISQSSEVKKNVADYFSTPSIIEYNFSNYGVELTLEKLFLDLVNEPLKFFQQFVTPVDWTPNIMAMGSKNIVLHHIAEQLGDVATGVEVSADQVLFEIPDKYLFKPGTSEVGGDFVNIMNKLKSISAGLEDSNVFLDSVLYASALPSKNITTARNVAEKRLDIVSARFQSGLEHDSVDVMARADVAQIPPRGEANQGLIRIRIKQKDFTKDSKKPRKLDTVFGQPSSDLDVYDNFIRQLTDKKAKTKKQTANAKALEAEAAKATKVEAATPELPEKAEPSEPPGETESAPAE